jgi:hypothetical protein
MTDFEEHVRKAKERFKLVEPAPPPAPPEPPVSPTPSTAQRPLWQKTERDLADREEHKNLGLLSGMFAVCLIILLFSHHLTSDPVINDGGKLLGAVLGIFAVIGTVITGGMLLLALFMWAVDKGTRR